MEKLINKNLLVMLTENLAYQKQTRPFKFRGNENKRETVNCAICQYKALTRLEMEKLFSIYEIMQTKPNITNEQWAKFVVKHKVKFGFILKYQNTKKYRNFNLTDFMGEIRYHGGFGAGKILETYNLEQAMDKKLDALKNNRREKAFLKQQQKYYNKHEAQEEILRKGIQTPLWEQDIHY